MAQRMVAFYDPDHPVVSQQKRELEAAVRVWQLEAQGETMIAAAGDRLLLTGAEDGVAHDGARALSDAMLGRSVVALRFKSAASAKELGELVFGLAESERRVLAAGGFAKIMQDRSVRSIAVTELDLEALLDGAAVDTEGFDDLVNKALTAVLALKAHERRRGSAVALTVERIDSPESLGALLDEIIDGAAPDALADPQAAQPNAVGPLMGLDADALAEVCAEAFGKATKAANADVLAEAAKILSSAMERLSARARFALLQKIAGRDERGAEALGREVRNPLIMSAITQVVSGQDRDSKLAVSIADLLERLRPVERERQLLIDQLDDDSRRKGHPLDAIFLQELNELSQKQAFGALELPIRDTREVLVQAALVRQTTRGQPDIVTTTFASLRPDNQVERTVKLLVGMLAEENTLMPATLSSVRGMLTLAASEGSVRDMGSVMVFALWKRALRDGPSSPASRQLMDLAATTQGPDWGIALLSQIGNARGADAARLLGDFLRAILLVHTSNAFAARLSNALNDLEGGVMRAIERRIAEFPPLGVAVLVHRAGTDSPAAGLALSQVVMRTGHVSAKEAALRALSAFVDAAVLDFLGKTAGLEGDSVSAQMLSMQKDDSANLTRLQRMAVEALGASRTSEAVALLEQLLTRTRLIGGAELDRMRQPAARALVAHGSPEAREVLEAGKTSKNRAVRLACGGRA